MTRVTTHRTDRKRSSPASTTPFQGIGNGAALVIAILLLSILASIAIMHLGIVLETHAVGT